MPSVNTQQGRVMALEEGLDKRLGTQWTHTPLDKALLAFLGRCSSLACFLLLLLIIRERDFFRVVLCRWGRCRGVTELLCNRWHSSAAQHAAQIGV